jgi:hypothetical protein
MNFYDRSLIATVQRALTLALSCLFAAFAGHTAMAQAAKPQPDTIVFTNGDQLTGTFERALGDSVVFKSDMAGEITVPFSKIKQLRSGSDFAVLRTNRPVTKQPVPLGPINVEGDNITVSTVNAPEYTIPLKDVAFIIDKTTYQKETDPHPSFTYGWNGVITGGATIIAATQTGNTYNAGIALIRAIPTVPYLPKRNRTLFNLTETYGKITQPAILTTNTPYSQVKTSIFHIDAEQDEYFSPRFYVLGALSFDHNFSLGLNWQQIYGGGVGWTAIQDAKQELDLRGDIHYEKQSFIQPLPQIPPLLGTPDKNLIGATISENYLRHLPGKLLLTEAVSFLPAFNDPQAYSANGMIGLALPVFHRLAVNLSTTDTYLNEPAAGFRKNSYQFITGVSYSLH